MTALRELLQAPSAAHYEPPELFVPPTSRQSAMEERTLLRGYRNTPTTPALLVEPCACGGEIEAPDESSAIATAVLMHNRSTRHEQWWRRREEA